MRKNSEKFDFIAYEHELGDIPSQEDKGVFSLGITESDICMVLSRFVGQRSAKRESVFFDRWRREGLREYMSRTKKALSKEQHAALATIAMEAQRATDAKDRQPFITGYGLYVRLAQDTDKFIGKYPYGFEDMRQLSVKLNVSEPSEVMIDLEHTALENLPAACRFADTFLSLLEPMPPSASINASEQQVFKANYAQTMHLRMLRAGMALAYEHCFEYVAGCEQEAAVLAGTQ